jgi:hypothetical protein
MRREEVVRWACTAPMSIVAVTTSTSLSENWEPRARILPFSTIMHDPS